MLKQVVAYYQCNQCDKPEASMITMKDSIYKLPYRWTADVLKHYCWDCSDKRAVNEVHKSLDNDIAGIFTKANNMRGLNDHSEAKENNTEEI